MQKSFFKQAGPFSIAELCAHLGLASPEEALCRINSIRTLDEAGTGDLSFFDNRKYLQQLEATNASACLIAPAFVKNCPAHTLPIVVAQPYIAFAKLLALFYPDALKPQPMVGTGNSIAASARIAPSAIIEPGAVIGKNAAVGATCIIGANAVIGPHVKIGAGTSVGAACVLQHCEIGANVVLHPGVKIGQDGFGYAFQNGVHLKVPQVGRVIIADSVEIGANSSVDRGALRDTIIGEGTKIDNLVQIGHNVQIGAHCVIVGGVGVSGSVILEDHVMIGGASSVAGHVRIGKGAQIAAVSTVKDDVPPGARYGGVPAKPVKQWFREMAVLSQLAARDKQKGGANND